MVKKAEKLTFGQGLAALEKVVDEMENKDLSLEELLSEYAKGVMLLKDCREKLAVAEKQLEDLTCELEGSVNG